MRKVGGGKTRTIVAVYVEGIVRNVADKTGAAAAGRATAGWRTGPDLDAGAIATAGHVDIVDINVLNNVNLALVLAETADRDAVTASAVQVLDNHVGRVGLEGDAVWLSLVSYVFFFLVLRRYSYHLCSQQSSPGRQCCCFGRCRNHRCSDNQQGPRNKCNVSFRRTHLRRSTGVEAGDLQVHVANENVRRVGDEVEPVGRVAHGQARDRRAVEAVRAEKNGTQDGRVGHHCCPVCLAEAWQN